MEAYRRIDIGSEPRRVPQDPGAAPMLQWVKVAALVVDDAYQRELGSKNWRQIRKIAAEFAWSKFSPIFCAPVAGGRFAIIDGQHRAHAAAICGFEEVPAQIVQMSGAEQAAAFAAVNGNTVAITGFHVLKAALAAGDEWALAASRACADAGCRLMTSNRSSAERKPGEIYTIRSVTEQVDAGRSALVTYALEQLRLSETGDDPDAWNASILRPWLAAVCDRPRLLAAGADLRPFLDEAFDIWAAGERVDDFMRKRRREGVGTASRFELLAAEIGTGLDVAFPTRMRAAE